MPSTTIQWFPGHMAKARRKIKEVLPQIDVIIELLDARIPASSKNPELYKTVGNKPVLTVLSKSSLADPEMTAKWKRYYASQGRNCIFADCVTGVGMSDITATIKEMTAEKSEKYESRGMGGRTIKAMIVGIPNVGKSSFINKMAGAKKAKAENRPGVTKDNMWITTKTGILLLDTPGVLWPKFEDKTVGENLAMTGAINDDILDTETIAFLLCKKLRELYPELLFERYKLGSPEDCADLDDTELFEEIGRKRGLLVSGGEVSYEKISAMLIDEFRSGKIGRITLEAPPEF